ncbi:MAG TPA: DNA-directed RNA polymerase subunit delta, partial [Firmicutes bacterium]|nr:DNA-directed RNA polymerase subunit delta [Bacillota bacterium]
MNKSMIDTAYDVAKSKGKLEQIKFEDLLVRTMVAMGVSADDNDKIIAQAGKLYTDLTMDGRFLQVKVEKDDSSKKKSKG